MSNHITQERLKRLVQYDPDSGVFTWLVRRSPKAIPGTRAGHIQTAGYRQIVVDGRTYVAHRLAWLYVHGQWPKRELDHVNGVRDDNRIANLREATSSQNRVNAVSHRVGNSGFPGVHEFKPGRWRVCITTNGKRTHLGVFYDLVAAVEARKRAEANSHPEFRTAADRPRYPTTRPRVVEKESVPA